MDFGLFYFFTHFESMRIGFLPSESRIIVSAMNFNILLQNTKLLQLNQFCIDVSSMVIQFRRLSNLKDSIHHDYATLKYSLLKVPCKLF